MQRVGDGPADDVRRRDREPGRAPPFDEGEDRRRVELDDAVHLRVVGLVRDDEALLVEVHPAGGLGAGEVRRPEDDPEQIEADECDRRADPDDDVADEQRPVAALGQVHPLERAEPGGLGEPGDVGRYRRR